MRRPRRTKAEKLIDARIQNSVYGFMIPMMSIPPLYRVLREACIGGKSNDELKAIVAAFPGVTKT